MALPQAPPIPHPHTCTNTRTSALPHPPAVQRGEALAAAPHRADVATGKAGGAVLEAGALLVLPQRAVQQAHERGVEAAHALHADAVKVTSSGISAGAAQARGGGGV